MYHSQIYFEVFENCQADRKELNKKQENLLKLGYKIIDLTFCHNQHGRVVEIVLKYTKPNLEQ